MTDAYYAFEARVEPMEWGKSVYTVLRVPSEVAAALAAQNAKRVEGEINNHPVNLALTKAPVIDGVFLWAGKTLLDEIGISPGDLLDVRLRKADDSVVEVDTDVMLAIRQAGATDRWNALTPGKRRGLLHGVTTAKRAETRQKRIAKMIADLP
ncbi:MAG: YdeI/OmpD-associated family protein [Pseudomonadota bacterium]